MEQPNTQFHSTSSHDTNTCDTTHRNVDFHPELHILPELVDVLGEASEEYRAKLESLILANGSQSPIIVWKDHSVIADGMTRFGIYRKHNIPFDIIEMEFEDVDAVKLWMMENQFARRNLSAYQRTLLAIKFEPIIKIRAKKNLSAGGRKSRKKPCQNSDKAIHAIDTKHELARLAGVSHDSIAKVKKIEEFATDETKAQLMRGDISIHKAYTEIMQEQHAGEMRLCERCGEEKPVSEFAIVRKKRQFSTCCKRCEVDIAREIRVASAQARESIAPDPKPEPVIEPEPTAIPSPATNPKDLSKRPRGIFTPERHIPPEWEKRRLSTDPVEEAFQLVYECLYPPVLQFLQDVKEVYERYHPDMRTPERTKQLRDILCTAIHMVNEFDAFIRATQADSVNKNNEEVITHE